MALSYQEEMQRLEALSRAQGWSRQRYEREVKALDERHKRPAPDPASAAGRRRRRRLRPRKSIAGCASPRIVSSSWTTPSSSPRLQLRRQSTMA